MQEPGLSAERANAALSCRSIPESEIRRGDWCKQPGIRFRERWCLQSRDRCRRCFPERFRTIRIRSLFDPNPMIAWKTLDLLYQSTRPADGRVHRSLCAAESKEQLLAVLR